MMVPLGDLYPHTGMTPLVWASRLGDVSMVETLLGSGANPSLKGRLRNSALWWARKQGHIEVKKALFRAEAKL